jgi:hypothetical protein
MPNQSVRRELLQTYVTFADTTAYSLLKWLITSAVFLSGGGLVALLNSMESFNFYILVSTALFALSIIFSLISGLGMAANLLARTDLAAEELWQGDSIDFHYKMLKGKFLELDKKNTFFLEIVMSYLFMFLGLVTFGISLMVGQ